MPTSDFTIDASPFGTLPDGSVAQLFTVSSPAGGIRASFTDYGAALVSLHAPDRDGQFADVVLGYDTLAGYLGGKSHFGATIGRYGNRIAAGRFMLDGAVHTLPLNNGPNHLHGGPHGFGHQPWKGETSIVESGVQLHFSRISPDEEEGYPGTMHVDVTYTLNPKLGTLRIDYRATTDMATPVNLTNHSYFNLRGHAAGDILGHELTIPAGAFLPTNATLIPTGELRPVAGTPFEFQTPHVIGERIAAADEQLKLAGGYDHCFIFRPNGAPRVLHPAAQVVERTTGRTLKVTTTEPGMQFYSGNFLDGTEVGKGGVKYARRNGFCLETQHFPDSPNQPGFPNTILRPGEKFESTTVYTFGVE